MKLKTLALAVVLMGMGAVQASAQDFHLGIEGGANLSSLVGSGAGTGTSNSTKLGIVGGGFLSLNFGPNFAVRPEILYEQKGSQVSGTTTTTELDYLEVPVLLKFGLGTPVVNPAILFGPSFNFNLLAQSAGGNISGINTSEIALVGGLEVDIDKFFVSGRYELGLNEVKTGSSIETGTITLLVGYSFM
jgi:hypothetical protein